MACNLGLSLIFSRTRAQCLVVEASLWLGSPAHQWSGFQVRPQLENHSAFPYLRQTKSLKTPRPMEASGTSPARMVVQLGFVGAAWFRCRTGCRLRWRHLGFDGATDGKGPLVQRLPAERVLDGAPRLPARLAAAAKIASRGLWKQVEPPQHG